MLSRVANSLYWMSRYIERAENIARIVDVNLQLLLDLRNLDEEQLAEHWLPIVQTTGDEEAFFKLHQKATAPGRHGVSGVPGREPEFDRLVHLPGARKRPHGARPDHARTLGGIEPAVSVRPLAAGAARSGSDSPSEFFQRNQGQLAAPHRHHLRHADSQRRLVVHRRPGKFLERADKTTRILDVRYQTLPERGVPETVSQTEALEWSAVLRSCSAWDAYKPSTARMCIRGSSRNFCCSTTISRARCGFA